MNLLVEFRFKHYAPRDSEEGTKEFIIASNLEQAIAYFDCEHLGWLRDMQEDGDKGSFCPDCFWLEQNRDKLQTAPQFALVVEDDGDDDIVLVRGLAYNLTLWLNGTTWKAADNLYYGFTHWDWSNQKEITDQEAETLIRLNIAKDIRKWSKENE
jgi:hypothetical protein